MINPCLSLIVTPSPSPGSFTYYIRDPTLYITIPYFTSTELESLCGLFTYTI